MPRRAQRVRSEKTLADRVAVIICNNGPLGLSGLQGGRMDRQRHTTEEEAIGGFLEAGSEIAGSLAGTGIGLLLGGTGGEVLGAVSGPLAMRALRHAAGEFAHRTLGEREKVRAASVIIIAAEQIDRKLKLGYEPRHDDFFSGQPGHR